MGGGLRDSTGTQDKDAEGSTKHLSRPILLPDCSAQSPRVTTLSPPGVHFKSAITLAMESFQAHISEPQPKEASPFSELHFSSHYF